MARLSTADGANTEVAHHEFGAFAGVFTPSILTILGVIMFMRAGFVVGEAGVRQALIILLLCKSITFLTSLSIAAISTNTEVQGGGSYFLISRSLGPEFGGAIGVTMYTAQALSVPFYILGFAESLVVTFPALQPYFLYVTLTVAALLLVVSYVGADWALRVQFVVLTVLVLSIVTMLGGAWMHFDPAVLAANWNASYTPGYSFWAVFAIYFPAVTGIDAGVNMSGDLKDPARSIPRGTLAAVLVGAAVYGLQIVLVGAAQERGLLIGSPFLSLVQQAPQGLGFLVTLGVFAATLSSAIGSFVGGPRILQALARDGIFTLLTPFRIGSAKGDEPRRALALTALIVFAVLWYAGNDATGGPLNMVASVITMFFLWAYGTLNLAAFVEAFSGNPSFRPRFRFFHWGSALVGAAACAAAAMLIEPSAAMTAIAILAGIFIVVRRKQLSTRYGDARRGFYYTRVRDGLFKLLETPVHPKNWRPTLLVFCGNPRERPALVQCAFWVGSETGIVTLVDVLPAELAEVVHLRQAATRRLQAAIEDQGVEAIPEVVAGPDFDAALPVILQSHSIAPIKPNVVMFGWPESADRIGPLVEHLQVCAQLGMSLLVVDDKDAPEGRGRRRIDLWWRGKENGSLMLILAHLITLHRGWERTEIRLLRLLGDQAAREPARQALVDIAAAARVAAEARVIISREPFPQVLHRESRDAALVVLGFTREALQDAEGFHRAYSRLLSELPMTLLVCSSGEADLMA